MALVLFEPGLLRDLMAGTFDRVDAHSAAVQISMAFFWIVPLAMAFLNLVLGGSHLPVDKCRVVTWGLLSAPGAVVAGLRGAVGAGLNMIALFATLVGLLILWHVYVVPATGARRDAR